MFASRGFRFASLFASILLVASVATVDQAEARRGGSFGSRGTRTFMAPAPTNTAPMATPPVNRSMTPNAQQGPQAATPGLNQPRGGFFGNGFGGALFRGLMFGGILGLLFGAGFGGFGGLFAMIVQVLVIGGLVMLALRFFQRRPATAGGPSVSAYQGRQESYGYNPGGGSSARANTASKRPSDEIGITQQDLETFESMLIRVQAAFAQENYAALRALATPEMVSYLSEELAGNATSGVRNDVSDVTLLQGDLSEAWREGRTEYATAAMRYSSIDVTRDRATGEVVEGDPDRASEATELWTFTRPVGGAWLLSAIQEA